MRILLADDDPTWRALCARMLARQPAFVVTTAEDGAEAWRLLDDPARSFDVLFLDLVMPHVDGFELLRRIRENACLRSLAIVLCTASADRASVVKAAQLGARHYLVKPCTPETLFAKLASLPPVS